MLKRLITAIRKREWATCCCLFFLYCAVLSAVYAKYYLNNLLPVSGDAITGLSAATYLKNALADGEFPLWNKYLAGGIPNTTTVTPIMLLAVFLSVKQYIYIYYIGAVALGATCAYAYFRRIGCDGWASFAISACYLLSIHLGGLRKNHAVLILTISMLPIILYCIEKYFINQKLRWLVASSIIMAYQMTAGFLQMALYTDLFLIAYLIAFGFHHKMKITKMLRHGLIWGTVYVGLVLWKILPMWEQKNVYSAWGAASKSSFKYFSSYSIHPVKLLQTLFPAIFGTDNLFQAFGPYYSSEGDIELFLGHLTVLLFIIGICRIRKNFRIRFFLGTMIIAFMYAASGHLQPIGEILYNIPIINGFRVPSRVLFIFIFASFSIAAISLSQFRDEEYRKHIVKTTKNAYGTVLIVTVSAVAGAGVVLGIQNGSTLDSFKDYLAYTDNSIIRDCLFILLSILLIYGVAHSPLRIRQYVYPGFCIVLLIITVWETKPYSMATRDAGADLFYQDSISKQIREEIGDGKVLEALDRTSVKHESIISQNKAMVKRIPTINAYIAMHNPLLLRMLKQENSTQLNESGILTGWKEVRQNLLFQNPLLSMLGVKYIIDSSHILPDDTENADDYRGEKETIEKTNIQMAVQPDEKTIFADPLPLRENTYYEIQAVCYSPVEQPLCFDFYGGLQYDDAAQQVVFSLHAGENILYDIIFTGDLDETLSLTYYWRLFADLEKPIEIRDITVSTIPLDIYKKWIADEDEPVYLNTKARDILYIPDSTQLIENEDTLYDQNWNYALDRVNYVTDGQEKTWNPESAAISEINFGYNQITAHVSSPEDTFVNFSQCWYPGWHAYVNGSETDVQLVNGLIMGIEVPAGETDLRIAYVPVMFYAGAAVSALFLAGVLIYFIIDIRMDKKRMKVG